MKKMSLNFNKYVQALLSKKGMLALVLLMSLSPMFANGGGEALSDAATTIRDYLPGIKALMKAIAIIVAIVGSIRIFNKWQNGDQDTTKEIIGWVGAIIFILLVPTFVDAVFPA